MTLTSSPLISSFNVIGNMTGNLNAYAIESVSKVSTNVNPDNVWIYHGNNGNEGVVNDNINGTVIQNIFVDRADNNRPMHKPSLSLSSNSCGSNLDQACQDQQQLQVNQDPTPDDSCLIHPEQEKCKPDQITGKCPSGFSMNENQHCFPDKPCPQRYEKHDNDETGGCYPIVQ
jgi:hypothetical protein